MTDYATLLRDHVTLKVRSIDRIFLQAYVPNLQTVGLVCRFLRWQRNFRIPSSAAFAKSASNIPRPSIALPHNGTFPGCSSRRDKTKGSCVLQDQRLCSLSDLALAEWALNGPNGS